MSHTHTPSLAALGAALALALLASSVSITRAHAAQANSRDAPQPALTQLMKRLQAWYLDVGDCTQTDPTFCDVVSSCATTCDNSTVLVASLQANGTWADIDYDSTTRSTWPLATHLRRTLTIARALRCPSCAGASGGSYDNATVLAAAHSALDLWLAKDFTNPNWWWPVIGTPGFVQSIMVLLNSTLTPSELAGGKVILDRAAGAYTGQNKVWVSQIGVTRGVLYGNASDVAASFDAAWSVVALSPGSDGIQPDGTFYQHGALVQNGAYGADLALDCLALAALSAGTPYEIPAASLDVLVDYVLDGQAMTLRTSPVPASRCNGGACTSAGGVNGGVDVWWDVVAKGREFARSPDGNPLYPRHVEGPLLLQLPNTTRRWDEVTAFAARLNGTGEALEGTHHFYWGDYTVHHRRAFFISLHMTSKRTFAAECVNGEGQQSWHLGDGMLLPYVSGGEYEGVAPVWDWLKPPGVTARQDVHESPCDKVKVNGATSHVGGASDGAYGVSTMAFHPNDFGGAGEGTPLTALKTWIFTDDGAMALTYNLTLGAGAGGVNVTTSLAQRKLAALSPAAKGDHSVYVDGIAGALPLGDHALPGSTQWVLHDSTVYVTGGFGGASAGARAHAHGGRGVTNMAPASLHVSVGNASGSWQLVSSEESNATVTMPMLSVWAHHGAAPMSGVDYAYAVVPGSGAATADAAAKVAADVTARSRIVANDASAQAVMYTAPSGAPVSGAVLFASVWQAGASVDAGSAGWRVSNVSMPVVLMVRRGDNGGEGGYGNGTGGVAITAADPSSGQGGATLTLLLDAEVTGDACAPATGAEGVTVVTVKLPGGDTAGSSVTVVCTSA